MTKKDTKKQDDEYETTEDAKETNGAEKKEPEELKQLKNKLLEAENSYKRALADYQNLQKRVMDERRDLILAANKELLLRILSVLDTLELANKHDESEGLKVAINQFLDVLKSEGVIKIEAIGQEFNPHLMEAVSIASNATDAESGEENKVIEEMRTGFMLNGKVLRPVQVKVGKKD